MASPIVLFSPEGTSTQLKSPFSVNAAKRGFPISAAAKSPSDSPRKIRPKSRTDEKQQLFKGKKSTPSAFLTPGILPQRRRSHQDATPTTTTSGNGSKNATVGKRTTIRPLRASPLFSESPYFGSGVFSASKACQALVHSPCRSENFRRQRRRLYHQDEFEEVKRKLSLPDSAGGPSVFKTPKLGKGGFGSVYIGKYGGKKVAIKQLHSKGQGESLCAELNAFRLHHPNIVKILTFSCSGPTMQIVFEYVGRRNLQQLLDETSENFPTNRRLEYCQQIADALQFCHSNRVLHLDVKSANILMTDDLLRCKLADFGCSRLMIDSSKNSETSSTSSLSSTSACLSASTPGTLMYKAPELLRGGSIPGPKADVYSFGYVLWQCATRQSPFEGMNMHTIVFCVVAKGLRPVLKKEIVDKLTEEEKLLVDLAQECWKATPEARPELSELHHLLRGYTENIA